MFRYLYYGITKYNIRESWMEGLWELLVLFSVKLFQNKKSKKHFLKNPKMHAFKNNEINAGIWVLWQMLSHMGPLGV